MLPSRIASAKPTTLIPYVPLRRHRPFGMTLSLTVASREDALSDVGIQIDSLDVIGNKGFVEYRIGSCSERPS